MNKKNKIDYKSIELKEKSIKKLVDFKKKYASNDSKIIFEEMCFCLLTPQSSAKQALKSIENLKNKSMLHNKSVSLNKIENQIKSIRFYKTKAKRIKELQEKYLEENLIEKLKEMEIEKNIINCRKNLVKEINGYGFKEASHFLRNIGFFEEITILDRHVLKNLLKEKIIDEIPKTLNEKKYLAIENKVKEFCKKEKIKLEDLDLIFWSNQTNDIIK
ncbi:MAG: DNA lyase [Candidatus ainarchaeum sp.]|nr:DNA lyase [Candidatus ainarchaeum sp.]